MSFAGVTQAFIVCFKAFAVVWLLLILDQYVAQQRYESITAAPCNDGLCAMVRDSWSGAYFWVPLPPVPAKDIITGKERHGGVSI